MFYALWYTAFYNSFCVSACEVCEFVLYPALCIQDVVYDLYRNRYTLVDGVILSDQAKAHYTLAGVGVAFLHVGGQRLEGVKHMYVHIRHLLE